MSQCFEASPRQKPLRTCGFLFPFNQAERLKQVKDNVKCGVVNLESTAFGDFGNVLVDHLLQDEINYVAFFNEEGFGVHLQLGRVRVLKHLGGLLDKALEGLLNYKLGEAG